MAVIGGSDKTQVNNNNDWERAKSDLSLPNNAWAGKCDTAAQIDIDSNSKVHKPIYCRMKNQSQSISVQSVPLPSAGIIGNRTLLLLCEQIVCCALPLCGL